MSLINGKQTVAMVNTKSGGKGGALFVLAKMKEYLKEENVFSLFSGDPERFAEDAAEFIVSKQPAIIIVAGGDGTLSFVMNCTKLCHDEGALPLHLGRVSPFPLGTGNDLSCSLGFGSGFSRWVVMGNSRFRKAFEVLAHSAAVDFDRWNLTITPSGAPSSRKCIKKIMNNYFSVGFDAGCAGHMAHLREKYPKFFITRPVVKLWYAFTAAVSLFRDGKIGKKVILRIDGKEVRLPYNPKAVVVANINSYAGGSTIWNPSTDKERFLVPSSNDGLIEVLCLRGVWHLALARLDLGYGTKLGQGRHVELEISSDLPCQYDGEFIDSLPSLGEKIQLSFDYYTSCEVQQTVPKYTPYFAYIAFFLTVLFVIVSHFL